jgi:hypothetical protein
MSTLYLLVYSHRHGEDHSLHPTEDDAKRAAAEIMVEWLADLDSLEHQGNILSALESGDYYEAMCGWSERSGESLYIEPMEVCAPTGEPDYAAQRARINDAASRR